MPRMNVGDARDLAKRIQGFYRLERRATDEVGWIQLAYSCTRAQAEAKIERAKALLGADWDLIVKGI
jgi:hypothetical protein